MPPNGRHRRYGPARPTGRSAQPDPYNRNPRCGIVPTDHGDIEGAYRNNAAIETAEQGAREGVPLALATGNRFCITDPAQIPHGGVVDLDNYRKVYERNEFEVTDTNANIETALALVIPAGYVGFGLIWHVQLSQSYFSRFIRTNVTVNGTPLITSERYGPNRNAPTSMPAVFQSDQTIALGISMSRIPSFGRLCVYLEMSAYLARMNDTVVLPSGPGSPNGAVSSDHQPWGS